MCTSRFLVSRRCMQPAVTASPYSLPGHASEPRLLVQVCTVVMVPGLTSRRGALEKCSPWACAHDAGDAPRWVYTGCGLACLAYLHLDCLDGKQARRTSSSSPLGQLFDHGAAPLLPRCHSSAGGPLWRHSASHDRARRASRGVQMLLPCAAASPAGWAARRPRPTHPC